MSTNLTVPQIPVSQPTVAGGTPPHKTLRRPIKDAEVLLLKKGLGIPVNDDDFDAATEAAVRAFQRTKGLVPDGIVGPKTWESL
jgi:murein L,D-transpeptidase YcbB/YkuD